MLAERRRDRGLKLNYPEAIAFISGAMLVWPLVRNRAGGPSLSTLQATQLINGKNAQIVLDETEVAARLVPEFSR